MVPSHWLQLTGKLAPRSGFVLMIFQRQTFWGVENPGFRASFDENERSVDLSGKHRALDGLYFGRSVLTFTICQSASSQSFGLPAKFAIIPHLEYCQSIESPRLDSDVL